jgi:hypothetical protein
LPAGAAAAFGAAGAAAGAAGVAATEGDGAGDGAGAGDDADGAGTSTFVVGDAAGVADACDGELGADDESCFFAATGDAAVGSEFTLTGSFDGSGTLSPCEPIDGATGETKYKAAMPATPRDPRGLPARYPRILGDCLAFADLRGTGARRDLIIKDRYRNVWAFTDKLEPLWHTALNTGHYPFPFDVDGDGREELAVGYALLGPDGKVHWNNEDKLQDHADGIAIVRLKDGAEPVVLYTASSYGVYY